MSDPVSNADIEDVLSSIRRLVSDEPVGGAKRRPEPEAAMDRFVLTPALRVVESEPEEDEKQDLETGEAHSDAETSEDSGQIPSAFESEAEWTQPAEQAARNEGFDHVPDDVPEQEDSAASPGLARADAEMSLHERIAELEAAIENAPQEWEPDGSEGGDSDETRPLSFDTDPDGARIDDALVLTDPEPEMPEDAGAQDSEENDTAEPAQAQAAEAEPDPQAIFETPAPEDAAVAEEAPVAEAEVHDWQDVETEIGFAADAPDHVAPETVEPETAEPKATDPAPVAASPDDTDELSEPQGDSTQTADASENFLAEEEATLDEEALREMVSDIVREELQGVLGERITRNVRRLVRREIQRAMAMRDLE